MGQGKAAVEEGRRELDLASFFASSGHVDAAAARWWIDRWMVLTPPGAELTVASIASLRDELDAGIRTLRVGLDTAAHLAFVVEFAAATQQFESRNWAGVLTAYLAQLCLTDEEWAGIVRGLAGRAPAAQAPVSARRDGADEASDVATQRASEPAPARRLRFGDLPSTLLVALHDADGAGALRELAGNLRRRARDAVDDATETGSTYDEWIDGLARAGVALAARRLFPVSRRMPRGPVAAGPAPVRSFAPASALLFAPDELAAIQDGDAELDEHEGHLSTAVTLGLYGVEALRTVIEDIALGTRGRELAIQRQELRVLRARFRLPPYLAAELDAVLSS